MACTEVSRLAPNDYRRLSLSYMADPRVIYLRNVPPDLVNRLKAAAALDGLSLQKYLVQLLQTHVADLERRGFLPKNKSK